MNLILDVEDLANEFMKNPSWIQIDHDRVAELADKMIATGIKPFPSTKENHRVIVLKELVASSINYCYWYGSSNIRPNNCGSSLMYEIVNNVFNKNYGHWTMESCIADISRELALNRFPLLEERLKHLAEMSAIGGLYATMMEDTNNPYKYFKTLIEKFPGFASDLFLKRASLFFLQLYRTLGWFKDFMQQLPVPADYQVPKMLRHFKCIEYHSPLSSMVENGQLIPKGSLMECEIRAATIIVCELLRQQTKWNMSDIDSWLWLRRKECNDPFHLTITTDY